MSDRPLLSAASMAVGIVVAAALVPVVHADVLTFNDLGPSTGGALMPGVYGGLQWLGSSWHYMTAPSGNTFLALSTPSTLVRLPAGGREYTFAGVQVWSRRGLDALGDFYFVLYHDGVTVYNGFEDHDGRQRFDGKPRVFVPNYTGPIDAFAIGFDNDDHDHIAIDNLEVVFQPRCRSDLDGDGTVGGSDLAILLAAWGGVGSADIDGDGLVLAGDLAELLGAWGVCG